MEFSMQIYIVTEVLFSITCLCFCGYLAVLWRPDTNVYDAYLIFVTGAPLSVLLITQPLISCFLGIDRCFVFVFPFKDNNPMKFFTTILTLISTGIFWALIIIYYILPCFPSTSVTNCRSFGCLNTAGTSQMYTLLRYITAVGSVVIGGFLFKLFKSRDIKNLSKKSTRLVVITLIAAIIFDFFPHLISFGFSTFGNFNLGLVIGPYSLVVSSVNSFVCGYFYYKMLKLPSIVVSSTTTIY